MAQRIPERVFISYSRKDQQWLERLQVQLAPLTSEGKVDLWFDTGEIEPGDQFLRNIEEGIDTASAAVLLVSADFQASDFIRANELPRLRRYADAGELRLFWVPVGHCLLADQLGGIYHTVGNPEQPLEDCSPGETNKVLTDLARSLDQHVSEARRKAREAREAELARKAEEEARKKREAREAELARKAEEEARKKCEAREAELARESGGRGSKEARSPGSGIGAESGGRGSKEAGRPGSRIGAESRRRSPQSASQGRGTSQPEEPGSGCAQAPAETKCAEASRRCCRDRCPGRIPSLGALAAGLPSLL